MWGPTQLRDLGWPFGSDGKDDTDLKQNIISVVFRNIKLWYEH